MFLIKIYKNSRKVKINRNYVSKYNPYLCFLMKQNLLISDEKMLMPKELKGSVTWFIYFLDLLWIRYNCTKFHHFRICVTKFREGALLPLPSRIHEHSRKNPFWIGLRLTWFKSSKFFLHKLHKYTYIWRTKALTVLWQYPYDSKILTKMGM